MGGKERERGKERGGISGNQSIDVERVRERDIYCQSKREAEIE